MRCHLEPRGPRTAVARDLDGEPPSEGLQILSRSVGIAAQRMDVRHIEFDSAAEERAADALGLRRAPCFPRRLALGRGHVERPLAADGEIALIDDGLRTASVTADSALRVFGLTSWEFRPIVESNASIAWKLLKTMAARLREAEGRAGG